MNILLKIRVDGAGNPFRSMLLDGPAVGERFTWGSVGRGADFRTPADVKFLREGGIQTGQKVIVRERQSAQKTYFVGVMEVVGVNQLGGLEPDDIYQPEYVMLERFDGSPSLDTLRSTHPELLSLPHFRKNEKGFMLRAFTELSADQFNVIVSALRV